MLTTYNRRRDYKAGHADRVAKFMPRQDGPYTVLHSNPELLSYTLDIPGTKFNTFYVDQLRKFVPNDAELFPQREYSKPGPIVTEDGMVEHFIDRIIDERKRGRGKQYLVR